MTIQELYDKAEDHGWLDLEIYVPNPNRNGSYQAAQRAEVQESFFAIKSIVIH